MKEGGQSRKAKGKPKDKVRDEQEDDLCTVRVGQDERGLRLDLLAVSLEQGVWSVLVVKGRLQRGGGRIRERAYEAFPSVRSVVRIIPLRHREVSACPP
jgi:hypothetical protein